MSREAICDFLATMTIGCPAVARYCDLPVRTIEYFAARNPNATMSPARQRLLSKVLAKIASGELVAVKEPRTGRGASREVLVPPTKPARPIVRYAVQITRFGPQLMPVDRPRPFDKMPTMKAMLTRGK